MDSGFSVLMSVYYKEKPEFFNLALKSNLVDQTLCPNELVLICDGDLTPELDKIVEDYTNRFPGIFKVYRKQNEGLGKALRYGLPLCSFPLVARSDSDDICVNTRFKKQFNYLQDHPEISILGSDIDEFEVDCNNPSKVKRMPSDHDGLYKMSKFRNPMNHMTVMMRKDEILTVGSYRHIPYVEDYELWVRAIVNGLKLANINEVLVHARVGNGMIKRRGNRQYIQSWKELCDYMLENHMINRIEYYRNLISVRAFVYMPGFIKSFVYGKLLRG